MPTASLTVALSTSTPPPAAVLDYTESTGPQRLALSGAQTYAIDLAMMPAAGLKGLQIRYAKALDSGAAASAPITITWTSNAVQKSEELTPGGLFALGSPSPVHGITALSITTTADAVVYVEALG